MTLSPEFLLSLFSAIFLPASWLCSLVLENFCKYKCFHTAELKNVFYHSFAIFKHLCNGAITKMCSLAYDFNKL